MLQFVFFNLLKYLQFFNYYYKIFEDNLDLSKNKIKIKTINFHINSTKSTAYAIVAVLA